MRGRLGDLVDAVIDLSAEIEIVEDYELELRETVVLHARIEFARGFIDVDRNVETGTVAYAWEHNALIRNTPIGV